MIITLPWPDKRLTPNAKRRKHWRSYRPLEKADRETGYWRTLMRVGATLRSAITEGNGPIPIKVTFFPPDRRKRDDDGMIGAFKHMRDGIADALHCDDNRFRPEYHFSEPQKPGRVEVTIG